MRGSGDRDVRPRSAAVVHHRGQRLDQEPVSAMLGSVGGDERYRVTDPFHKPRDRDRVRVGLGRRRAYLWCVAAVQRQNRATCQRWASNARPDQIGRSDRQPQRVGHCAPWIDGSLRAVPTITAISRPTPSTPPAKHYALMAIPVCLRKLAAARRIERNRSVRLRRRNQWPAWASSAFGDRSSEWRRRASRRPNAWQMLWPALMTV